MKITEDGFAKARATASFSHKPQTGLRVAGCLALVRCLTAREDLNATEEEVLAELESELTADLVAIEFTKEVDRLFNLDRPESAAFLDSFAAWVKRPLARRGVHLA